MLSCGFGSVINWAGDMPPPKRYPNMQNLVRTKYAR